MILLYLFFLLLCVYESQQKQVYNFWKYQDTETAESSHKRIMELMRSYYEEAHARSTYLNPIRFMYEESPYYEMGYIVGEIIERYRKVLEQTQRPVRFLAMPIIDILKRVELVQQHYFEIYHLVRMLHETPRKWAKVPEYKDIEMIAGFDTVSDTFSSGTSGKRPNTTEYRQYSAAEILKMQDRMKDLERQRRRQKKKIRKEYDKIRKEYFKNFPNQQYGIKAEKKIKSPWEIEYGWEIDYLW